MLEAQNDYFVSIPVKNDTLIMPFRDALGVELSDAGADTSHILSDPGYTELVSVPAGTFERAEPLPRTQSGSDWILLPFILSLILITISRAAYRRRFRSIFLSLFSSNSLNIMQREGNILSEPVSVLLFGNFLLMISMLLFLLPGLIPAITLPELPPFLWYPIIIVGVLLFIFLKVSGITLSGNVFRTENESSAYLLNMFLFDHAAGVLLWPFLLASVYLQESRLVILASFLVIALFAFRGVKGMIIGFQNSRFSPVLFLLYLCTLEIIPLLIVVKLVENFA